jgi:hypothetical protein
VRERLYLDADEQEVAPSKATHVKLTVVLTKDHYADVSQFNLGTTIVDGREVPFATYKLSANLELTLKLPSTQAPTPVSK